MRTAKLIHFPLWFFDVTNELNKENSRAARAARTTRQQDRVIQLGGFFFNSGEVRKAEGKNCLFSCLIVKSQ